MGLRQTTNTLRLLKIPTRRVRIVGVGREFGTSAYPYHDAPVPSGISVLRHGGRGGVLTVVARRCTITLAYRPMYFGAAGNGGLTEIFS